MITTFYKKIGFAFTCILLITGCDDAYLKQASKLSDHAQELQSVFEHQATDYVESCYRQANHQLISPEKLVFTEQQLADSGAFKLRQDAIRNCNDDSQEVNQARNNFVLQNQVISNYLLAIANLAQDENFVLLGQDEKAKLDSVFKNSGISNASGSSDFLANINPAKAFSTLVNFIYEASAKDYATDELKTEVVRINPSLQNSICYFKSGWQKAYGRQLEFEADLINSYYENTIRQVVQRDRLDFERSTLENQNLRQSLFQTSVSEDNLLTNYVAYPKIYQYDQEWQNKLDALQKRKSTLSEYIEVLDKIAQAHASLAKASGAEQPTYCQQPDSPQVKLQDIDAYLDEIGDNLKAIKSLEVKKNYHKN